LVFQQEQNSIYSNKQNKKIENLTNELEKVKKIDFIDYCKEFISILVNQST
jgi:virulence-associated protein VapD